MKGLIIVNLPVAILSFWSRFTGDGGCPHVGSSRQSYGTDRNDDSVRFNICQIGMCGLEKSGQKEVTALTEELDVDLAVNAMRRFALTMLHYGYHGWYI